MKNGSFGRVLLATLIIWVAGVVSIRLFGDLVLKEGSGIIIGFVVTALAGPPTVVLGALIIGCRIKQMLVPTMTIAMLALLADGFTMSFVPYVYTDASKIRWLAPMFLWTFGWACLSAFVMSGTLQKWETLMAEQTE